MISRRPATDDDRAFAHRTHHSAYREVVERQFGEWNDAQQDAFFASDWRSATYEIILVGDHSVGYCAIEHRVDDVHVRELVLDTGSQGRGIGSGIIRELQIAAARDGKPIRLGTLTENRALALYRRLGFEPVGRTETHVLLEWTPCAPSEASASSEDRAAIDALRNAWVAAVEVGDAGALADLDVIPKSGSNEG